MSVALWPSNRAFPSPQVLRPDMQNNPKASIGMHNAEFATASIKCLAIYCSASQRKSLAPTSAIACAAEHDEKQRQAQAAGTLAAAATQPEASQPAPQLPAGLNIPSMPKGWKPGMPIPGRSDVTLCIVIIRDLWRDRRPVVTCMIDNMSLCLGLCSRQLCLA